MITTTFTIEITEGYPHLKAEIHRVDKYQGDNECWPDGTKLEVITKYCNPFDTSDVKELRDFLWNYCPEGDPPDEK